MNSKNKNASNEPSEDEDKHKQADQQPKKVYVKVLHSSSQPPFQVKNLHPCQQIRMPGVTVQPPVIVTLRPGVRFPQTIPGLRAKCASTSNRNISINQSGVETSEGMSTQTIPNSIKMCKTFLLTLVKQAREQPPQKAISVLNLIQGLIDNKVDPKTFTMQLEKKMGTGNLEPFLKSNLPLMQKLLQIGELSIDGIRPPPRNNESIIVEAKNPKIVPLPDFEKQPDWKIAVSALEDENKMLKTEISDVKEELNCLKNSLKDIRDFIQREKEKGHEIENQNSRKEFTNPFAFEDPPEHKKIKLEPDETLSEEIQTLKNKNLKLTKEIEDLKKKQETCVCHAPAFNLK